MVSGCDRFLLGHRNGVKEGLHWGLSEASAALMRALFVVVADPQIEIDLQLVDRMVQLFAERDPIKLVEQSFVEALTNTVIRYVMPWRLAVRLFPKGDGVMVSPSGTRGAGSTKVRAGRR